MLFEFFAALLERFTERYLEPPSDPRGYDRLEDAWFAYRLERLERRMLWLFRLVVTLMIVDLILALL